MAYVPVPKDLTKIKTKIMFNLTKRQLIVSPSGDAFDDLRGEYTHMLQALPEMGETRDTSDLFRFIGV